MMYQLYFSDLAKEHLRTIRDKYPDLRPKVEGLLQELTEHPQYGTGKPERLRFKLAGFMSRRINLEHRLIYRIDEDNQCVWIESLLGHYEKL